MSHVTTFREYLERQFGITLTKDAVLNEQEGVIRVYSKTLMRLKPSGYMGFVAGKVSTKGIEAKSEFLQLFGRNAKKNILVLDEAQARAFVESECVETGEGGEGLKVARFGRHVLGVGRLRAGKLYPDFIGKGRKRVENSIKE